MIAPSRWVPLACVVLAAAPLHAQSWLDSLDDAFAVSSRDGFWRANLSFLSDLEFYALEAAPQGTLAYIPDDTFLQPRLSIFLDAQAGPRVLVHAQLRIDRGFDPGASPEGNVQLNEYYIEWRVLGDDRLNLRAGRFPTVFGAWPARHLSWDNPLITAPLAYGDVLPLTNEVAPASLSAFAARRNAPDTPQNWVSIIWGPAYGTGASATGRLGDFDYAVALTNTALSSPPETWDAIERGRFDLPPNVTAKVAWHPAPEWLVGGSFSRGPWMNQETFPSASDFNQTTFGMNVSYAYGYWQLWMETIHTRFEVPGIGDVRATTAFLEAKRKLTPNLWAAARWNQTWFGQNPSLASDLTWDRNVWRLDLALGYRINRHAQFKLQYSIGDKSGNDPEGDHLFAAQMTVRF